MEYTYYQLLWFFLVYSLLGWVAETALAAVTKRRLLNRGFLNVPFSPVYGLAAVLFAIFLPELRSAPFFLFLGGMILATGLELATGILLERIFGQKWWDYTEERFQFEGHICLKYSVIWGLSSLVCVFVGDPLLARLTGLIPRPAGEMILLAAFLVLGIDFAGSWAAVLQWNGSLRRPSELSRVLRSLTDALDTRLTRAIQRRMARAYPSLERERLSARLDQRARRERPAVFAAGCGFYKLAMLFFLGALLGDVTETVFRRLTAGVWMSRSSVVYGPFSIVWGLGAVLLTAVLYKYRDRRDGAIFLAGTVLGGAYEYICSVFTELVFGSVFWDYSHLPFNLGGRINLLFCFFWGIAAVVWLKLIYPRLSGLIERLPILWGKALTWGMLAFMTVNIALSCLALGRYEQRRTSSGPPQSGIEAFLDERFPDERMERIYPNAIAVERTD